MVPLITSLHVVMFFPFPTPRALSLAAVPPNNPQKLAAFLKMNQLYHETKSARVPGDRKRKGKGASDTQGEYWWFMQQKMAELAKEGVQGGERMKLQQRLGRNPLAMKARPKPL